MNRLLLFLFLLVAIVAATAIAVLMCHGPVRAALKTIASCHLAPGEYARGRTSELQRTHADSTGCVDG
jgi:hypothetical protein